MRISHIEEDYLYNNKITNGKEGLIAVKEIERLKGYELGLTRKNNIINKLNCEIERLKKINDELKEKLKIKQNKDFKSDFLKTSGSNEEKIRRVKTFKTRVMNILNEEEKITLSALTKLCCIPLEIRDDVFKQLESENKIKIVKGNFTAIYKI